MSREQWELEAEVLLKRIGLLEEAKHRLELLARRDAQLVGSAVDRIEQLEASASIIHKELYRLRSKDGSRTVIALASFTAGLVAGSLLANPGFMVGVAGGGLLQAVGQPVVETWLKQIQGVSDQAAEVALSTGIQMPDVGRSSAETIPDRLGMKDAAVGAVVRGVAETDSRTPGGAILAEDGEAITSEDGSTLVTEDATVTTAGEPLDADHERGYGSYEAGYGGDTRGLAQPDDPTPLDGETSQTGYQPPD